MKGPLSSAPIMGTRNVAATLTLARTFQVARDEPPIGLAPDEAVNALRDVLGGIGDACPEC